MESKQELRDKIQELESQLRTATTKYNELDERYDKLLSEATETQRALMSIINPLVEPLIQRMIDKSMKNLSLSMDCDWGGFISASLKYNNKEIDSVTEQVCTQNNPEEE